MAAVWGPVGRRLPSSVALTFSARQARQGRQGRPVDTYLTLPSWSPQWTLLNSTSQLSAAACSSEQARRAPSLSCRRAPSYRSSLRPLPHPSIVPVGASAPELVPSGISRGILQRDLGQSSGSPFPLRPPALAALPLLLIVRGALGGQWAIQ